MECPICWGDLLEAPAAGVLPPQKKKSKSNTTDPTTSSSLVCLPCGHILHRKCILTWFQQNIHKTNHVGSRSHNHCLPSTSGKITYGTCPTCRDQVDEDEFYPAYLSKPKNQQKESGKESIAEIKQEPSSETSSSSISTTSLPAPGTSSSSISTTSLPAPGTSSSTISTTSLPAPETNASSTAATALDIGNSTIECENESCKDLLMRFNLLEKDFHEMLTKLQNETKRADLHQAMSDSLKLQLTMTTAKIDEANDNGSAENANKDSTSETAADEFGYDEKDIMDRDFNDDH